MKKVYLIILALSLTNLLLYGQQKTDQIKVLFVVTSHSEMGNSGKKTGFWLEEFAAPYYLLIDKGVKITVASPKGGEAPIDPRSKSGSRLSEASKRFLNDKDVQKVIQNTVKLDEVNAADFDAVFYPGGHGPLWDLAEDKTSINLIESFNNQGKPIAMVCHAPVALKNVKNSNGEPLVKGKTVTGFSNLEEEAVGLTDVVPILLEDMLKQNGGNYSKADKWQSHVVTDGNLVTGQNPASSDATAEKLYKLLKKSAE
ncbi:MAG: type 1 glutamine amidotransferase domain-containing protein [Salinivirgaceae bacterium]|nr:MAG: type 1 glutamine amidotransferase domain-containing protein [Salinivirgaceae bacterium]